MKTIRNILFIAILAFTLSNNVNAKETELNVASSHENTEETTLDLENWMLEESFWNISETENLNMETEEVLKLESWMLDDSNWKVEEEVYVEEEKELDFESWMFNVNYRETENSH